MEVHAHVRKVPLNGALSQFTPQNSSKPTPQTQRNQYKSCAHPDKLLRPSIPRRTETVTRWELGPEELVFFLCGVPDLVPTIDPESNVHF